ncbi:MAG TPA: ATP synthase F0 subunit B [Geminicoccaceae bacterium]|nr:ATP synthase F0 subunit B [Geminicoccus sp.]HMU52011.1 ATP synthase F0 subunit B [Geminicoccaceae bacterium]
MPGGNLFRREQRQQHRVQLHQARRELDLHMRQQEELRRLAAPQRAEAERIRREAEELARRRAEEARLQAEREAERIREQLRAERRDRRHLAQQQRQAAAAIVRQHDLDLRQQQVQARALAAHRLQTQLDADNALIAQLHPGLAPALQALAQQADRLSQRLTLLIGLLAGSADPHLATHRADLATLQPIPIRCRANRPQVDVEHRRLRTCATGTLEITTASVRAALVRIDTDRATDAADVTAIDIRVTAAELTHAAALAHARAYPNLGLTLAEIAHPEGVIRNFGAAQLARLNARLAWHPVQTWRRERMPNTRPNHRGAFLRIPDTIHNFPCRPSGEVFHDWLYDYAGHGQPAAEMRRFLAAGQVNVGIVITITATQQPNGNWVLTSPNLTLNVILDQTQTLLITFYKLG